MATKHKFKSDAFEAIHSSATSMYRVGAIDKTTMKEFERSLSHVATSPNTRANPEAEDTSSRQPTGFCTLSEHQRVDR